MALPETPYGAYDAVVTAGGRLSKPDAERFGTDVKALVRVDGRTLLEVVVRALRCAGCVGRIIIVGPVSAKTAADADTWIDEFPTGEQNLIAGLRAAATERIVLSASDLPFVTTASYDRLVALTPDDVDVGYPIFTRSDFLKAYPGGRASFAALADGQWTGGSAFVVNRSPLLRHEQRIARGFAARKSLPALAALLGPALLAKYLFGRLRVTDVEQRASAVLGARVRALTSADPALAMDCDELGDLAYAHADAVKR